MADGKEKKSKDNAMTLPRSGGFVILNDVKDTTVSFAQMKQVVPVWIQQVRELFQIKPIIRQTEKFSSKLRQVQIILFIL